MITSVKQVSEDVVEVRRSNVYKSNVTAVMFGKGTPNEEVITIDRGKINRRPTDIVLESVSDFGFKN